MSSALVKLDTFNEDFMWICEAVASLGAAEEGWAWFWQPEEGWAWLEVQEEDLVWLPYTEKKNKTDFR